MPARSRIRCGPSVYQRDQQFLHRDRLREGRRGRPHAEGAARRAEASAPAWTSISSATTARRRRSRSSSSASPTPTGTDLTQFMRWYAQAGTPEVAVTATLRREGAAPIGSISHRWCRRRPGQPSKEPMVIPLVIGLIDRDGNDLPLTRADGTTLERGVLVLDRAGAQRHLHRRRAAAGALAQPRLLGPDQGRRQPVGRRSALPRRARHATRSTAGRRCRRWRRACSSTTVAAVRAGRALRQDDGLIDGARARSCPTRSLEPAFVAQAMTMPSEADIAREIGRDVDPDAIFAARAALARRDRPAPARRPAGRDLPRA